MSPTRKLIEVAIPLDGINKESAREKSIRSGHPSTLHLWWARRPLAACRAVIFASLVDDPSAHPEEFPTDDDQEVERKRLFGIIEDLVKWENTTNEDVLNAARHEINRVCDGRIPTLLDPFHGGGSIPLEAQRLGLAVDASDLNPVAVLIGKALTELPPRFAGRPPVHPSHRESESISTWPGAQGMAADIRAYSQWMADRAGERIGHLYPEVVIPVGTEALAPVIAWIWARTIPCPNPACGATMPLLNSFVLCSRTGRLAWLRPVVDRDAKSVTFEIGHGDGAPPGGTVSRRGATCLVCEQPLPLSKVREIAQGGELGSQLVCTVAAGNRSRAYVAADSRQMAAAEVEPPGDIPDADLPHNPRAVTTPNYGIVKQSQLFTPRQLHAMVTFSDLVTEARDQVIADGADEEYADALATYLTLGIGRLANRCSSQCFWNPGRETVEQVFARNALPMIWVYAEANPFSESSGNFLGQIKYLADALERVPASGVATLRQLDASAPIERGPALVCTDPPYYDNVPYADLSDFFYIWHRRCLKDIYPDLYSTLLVPKAQELIAEPARHENWEEAATFFENGLRKSFENMLAAQDERYPMTVFYAFKQEEEDDAEGGHVSTGWETMLQGLLDAGATITGTWPVRTEQPGGLREVGRAALASSIVLVCRRRPADAPLATRKEFVDALRAEIPEALIRLYNGNIAPVDLAQASIGPGMAIFSRYGRVVEANGETMTVRSGLSLINQVLDEILTAQEGDFDAETRWAVAWYEECGMEEGSFGKADVLARAKNTAVNALANAGIIEARGNAVRLVGREELGDGWDPAEDKRLSIWEVTQHLIGALATAGESKAAELLRQVGGLGDIARELAYRLYVVSDRKGRTAEALAYNSLVVSWPEIARLARSTNTAAPEDGRLFVTDPEATS